MGGRSRARRQFARRLAGCAALGALAACCTFAASPAAPGFADPAPAASLPAAGGFVSVTGAMSAGPQWAGTVADLAPSHAALEGSPAGVQAPSAPAILVRISGAQSAGPQHVATADTEAVAPTMGAEEAAVTGGAAVLVRVTGAESAGPQWLAADSGAPTRVMGAEAGAVPAAVLVRISGAESAGPQRLP